MSVTFLPQFLGALPKALSPLGVPIRIERGEGYVRPALVHEDESPRVEKSLTPASFTKHFAPPRLVRRHPSIFFSAPPKLLRMARLIVEIDTLAP